jgi:5-(carboxyamino)imidazole ribonucleotide mutase
MIKKKNLVGIVMGSDSDLPVMKEAAQMLERFNIPFELEISSAHRSPERTIKYAREAVGRGLKILVVGAGGAAHLAGVIAAITTLPVIGVPMDTKALKGLDSLFSIVQMPKGIPVATLAIGNAGAANAGILCAEILALESPEIRKKLEVFKEELKKSVIKKSNKLKKTGYKKY